MLNRVAAAQKAANAASVPISEVIEVSAHWYTLQGLLGRLLIVPAGEGTVRLTGEGWRLLRSAHGRS